MASVDRDIDLIRKLGPDPEGGGGGGDLSDPKLCPDPSSLPAEASAPSGRAFVAAGAPVYEPLPKVIQAFKSLGTAGKEASWSPSKVYEFLREYHYLREVPSHEPQPAQFCPGYTEWRRELEKVFGGEFAPQDPAFFNHDDIHERNRLLAWACAMQQAARFRLDHPVDPLVTALFDEASKHFNPREIREREQYVDSIIASKNFLPETLEQAELFLYRPPLSLEAITRQMRAEPYDAGQKALEHAYGLVQFTLTGDQYGISRFSELTRMAATVAREGGTVDVVLSALLSNSSQEQLSSLRSEGVFQPHIETISRHVEALHILQSEQYFLPLPRDMEDLSLPSFSRFNDVGRFLQRTCRVAQNAKVENPGDLTLLFLADKLETLPAAYAEQRALKPQDLYHEAVTLLAQTADQHGFRCLSDQILKVSFAVRHPDDSRKVTCAIREALGMNEAEILNFMAEKAVQIERALRGHGFEPQHFKLFYRLKNPLSTFEKWRARESDKSLEDGIAGFDDLIGFEVRIDDNDGFELIRHELPGQIGMRKGMAFYGDWHQEKLIIPSSGGDITCEMQIKQGLADEWSYSKRHEPHVLLKDRRRASLISRTLFPSRTQLSGDIQASYDHIHPPLTGDRNVDFRNMAASLAPSVLMRVLDAEQAKEYGFSVCSTPRLPAGSNAVDLLASFYGSKWRDYVVVRPAGHAGPGSPARTLLPLDPLEPGETVEIRKVRGEDSEYLKDCKRRGMRQKIAENVCSLAGILHTTAADEDTRAQWRQLGISKVEEVFGPIDDWLSRNVLEPFRHWARLQDVNQLYESLGLKNNRGEHPLPNSALRSWYQSRYVQFSARDLGNGVIQVNSDEDVPGIVREISALALDLDLLISELTTTTPEPGSRSTIILSVDNTSYTPDEFAQKYNLLLERIGRIRLRRGDRVSQPYGLQHRIELNLDASADAIHELAVHLSGESELVLRDKKNEPESAPRKDKKEAYPNITSIQIELPTFNPDTQLPDVQAAAPLLRPVVIDIAGPGSSISNHDLKNRELFMEKFRADLEAEVLSNGRKLCHNVRIKPVNPHHEARQNPRP